MVRPQLNGGTLGGRMNMEDSLRIEAARYRLGVSVGDDLVRSALDALLKGRESPSLAVLAGERDPVMSDVAPLFEQTLRELNLKVPDAAEASWILLRWHLHRIANGTVEPRAGVQTILDEVYYPANLCEQTRNVVGDSHDIEDMLGYFYGLDDISDRPDEVSCDGKYGDAAVAAVESHLVRLAREWLDDHDDAG